MAKQANYDVIIIGGGIAALSAGMYAGRLGLKTLLVTKEIGGSIVLTHLVENYPAIHEISGYELANQLLLHAKKYNIDIKEFEEAKKIEKTKEGFSVSTSEETFTAKAVIYATGAIWKKLDAKGCSDFENKGIHYCALCDGAFYKGKTVAVIGGSDTAAKEALLLTEYAKKVYMIYRGKEIRPEPITKELVMQNNKIEIINNTNVIGFAGTKFLEKVMLDRAYDGKKELKLDGVFVAIGHIVLSDIAKKMGVKVNNSDEIITDKETKTNIEGFFAAGDVTDSNFKQAIIASAHGVMAAYSAYQYVKKNVIEKR